MKTLTCSEKADTLYGTLNIPVYYTQCWLHTRLHSNKFSKTPQIETLPLIPTEFNDVATAPLSTHSVSTGHIPFKLTEIELYVTSEMQLFAVEVLPDEF